MPLESVQCSECSHGVVIFDVEEKRCYCKACGALYEESE